MRQNESRIIFSFFSQAQEKAVSLTVARYLKEEKFSPKPSIRISVNIELTEAEIDNIASVLEQALKVVGQ